MNMSSDFHPGARARDQVLLFWACFTAIAATAFVFVVRGHIIGEWAAEFALNETQKGEILGVGMWPFAVSIVLFSLVIDRVGYGMSMLFAFVCHVASTIYLLMANDYWDLYIGTLLVSLGNGAAQAVADPVVASMFVRNKTKWLNIFHASWPAGMVVGGVLGIALADVGGLGWRWRIAMLFAPMLAYGVMMLGRKFPVHERVTAGVSYREMLRETGGLGMFLVTLLMFGEVGRVFEWHWAWAVSGAAVMSAAYGLYTRSLGQPMFLFLLALMIPLATTELGTDSWITPLMENEMKTLAINAGWVLVYTSLIMMILRFCAGPVVRILTPIGVLIVSSLIATAGLVWLSVSTNIMIFVAATVYALGKTYLWPTMLGVVAERFPRGGALSLNITSAVGMLSVGIVGAAFMGLIQDQTTENKLKEQAPPLHAQIVVEKNSVFGHYLAIDPDKTKTLDEPDKELIESISDQAKKEALATTALLPCIMLVGYVGLLLYFRFKGGYKTVDLAAPDH